MAVGAGLVALASCSDRPMLEPYPAAVIEVDTNLPVPLAISRLRVDVFSADGTWFRSSDFARADPLDWPVSFGIYSEDEANGATMWIRLRAYLDGEVEDYRGERFRDVSDPFAEVSPADGPRLMVDGSDTTPSTAPRPLATIDRLIRVRLEPSKTGRVRVLMHGACVGTMAKLGSDGQRPDDAAESCVDTEKTRVAVPIVTPTDLPANLPSEQGTWMREACDAPSPEASRVCIPGGATVLGFRNSLVDSFLPNGDGTTPPVRIFGVRRFYMDREEVSVGRFRAALARGLKTALPTATEGTLDPAQPCTWSAKPMGREEMPAICMEWLTARDFCEFEGGQLPSEVEWEHAATVAGRTQKQLYPWGNDQLGCEDAIHSRSPKGSAVDSACADRGMLPVAVTDGPGDLNALGVHGLGAGAREWTRDIFSPYTGPCWAAAPLANPSCRAVAGGAARSFRGGSWYVPLAPVASRIISDPSGRTIDVGIRCVYEGPEGGSP